MFVPINDYVAANLSYFFAGNCTVTIINYKPKVRVQERIQGGGAPPPPKVGKNKIFWRKIVIFHTKYPKNFRASLRWAQFF
jgi:hypothetical protein